MTADYIPGFGDITENETETLICILVGERQLNKSHIESYQMMTSYEE